MYTNKKEMRNNTPGRFLLKHYQQEQPVVPIRKNKTRNFENSKSYKLIVDNNLYEYTKLIENGSILFLIISLVNISFKIELVLKFPESFIELLISFISILVYFFLLSKYSIFSFKERESHNSVYILSFLIMSVYLS